MLDKIKEYEEESFREFERASTIEELEKVRVSFLGRKGKITLLLRSLKDLPAEEKKMAGKNLNILKNRLESYISDKRDQFLKKEKEASLDFTLPGTGAFVGALHPITQTIKEITDIFIRLGFEVVDGREIETERYNFTALNIPLEHSSRDAFDTFYTDNGYLLRSQTSTVQVHIMETRKPPFAIIAPGKVYRPDTVDASHSFMFHQIEGLVLGDDITFGDLKGTLIMFLKEFFGPDSKMRLRPHFFPFTEPSVEVDISCFNCKGEGCSTCGHQGWLEVLGAGLVDPEVLKAAGYEDGRYQGFAFGLGVERMAMLKHGIRDIRLFYENNLSFLRQF